VRINQATPQIQPRPAPPVPIDKESPLWKAAQGMEEQFMKEMLRNMRKTVDESQEEKDDRGLQIFRGMLDDHYAESAVRQQGIGLAELIVNQMLESQRPVNMAQPVPVRDINKNDTVKE
jgi:Rod binding domain-containing protein